MDRNENTMDSEYAKRRDPGTSTIVSASLLEL